MSSDEEQDICSICEGDKSTKKNPIIFCDGKDCDMPVHKVCYKVNEIPDDDWYCERCDNKRKKKPTNIVCCPMQMGAIKRTATSGDFMHVVCAMWNKVIDEDRVPYIVPTKQLSRHECYYCYKKKGFTMQCEADSCAIFFHATCAINNGIINPAPSVPANFSPRCNKHILEYEREQQQQQQQQQQHETKKEIPAKRHSPPNLFTDDSDDDMCLSNQTNNKQEEAPTPVTAKESALAITSQKPPAPQSNNANGSDKSESRIMTAKMDEKAYSFKERLEIKKRKIEHTNLKIDDNKPKSSSNSGAISSPLTIQKPAISSSSAPRPAITPPLKKTKGPGIIKDIAEIQNDIKAEAQRWNHIGSASATMSMNRNPAPTPTAAKNSFLEGDNTRKMLTIEEREELNRLRTEARRFNDFKRGVAEIFSSLNVSMYNHSTPAPDRDIEGYVAHLQQIVRRSGPIREQDSALIQDCVRNAMYKQRQ